MRWGRALLLSAVLWSQAALAALSPEAFTQEYATRLRAVLPDRQVEVVGPLKVRVSGGKEGEYNGFLDNAYIEYQQNPDARDDILQRHIAGVVAMSGDRAPVVAANIVPVVKDRGWLAANLAAVMEKGGKAPLPHLVEDINDVLVIVYGEDTPTSIRYIGTEDLAKAGVERSKLRALAIDNLRRLLPEVEIHDAGDFKMLTAGGTYEACLLLLDNIWNAEKLGLTGEIVVAVPSRDLLLITSSDNARGIARLRELADEVVAQNPYALTRELFVWRGGRFVPLKQ